MAIQFAWPLLRDKIVEYSCYISGNEIEIVPYNANVDVFGSFSKAKHRILMSATTQDDAYFVKGLSFDTKALSAPLMFSEQKWSGEKMIIIPSLINEECDRDLVVTEFSRMTNSKFGMVSLVPNTKKAQQYENIGAISADRNNIFEIIDKLKKREFSKLIVINNRYDGIDLPDETCRILIFDSLPFFNSLSGKYEKGWYLQQLARYLYPIRKEESIKIQKAAFINNTRLLKPKTGIEYRKVSYINENRMNRIRRTLCEYGDYRELCLSIDECLDNLSFGVEAEKFETVLKTIGDILGYISQRPDSEIRKGPDNLWCGINNNYCLFECKSEVDDSRVEISKHEAGQMNSHCAWFEEEYGKDTKVSRFLIIPTKELSYYGDFTHEVHIIRRNKLKRFKESIKRFIKELAPYNISDISDEKLQEFLNIHKLNMEDMVEEYSENYYHKTK